MFSSQRFKVVLVVMPKNMQMIYYYVLVLLLKSTIEPDLVVKAIH